LFNCSISSERIASVSCGSHSRFVGDLETSGRMIASRASSEKIVK
jgi:hypothetical protein